MDNNEIDISELKTSELSFEEVNGYLGPQYLNVKNKGIKLCRFYFNMRGFNQDFDLKNAKNVHFGFNGEMSKTKAISQFKLALKEGFTRLKIYK